MNEMWKAFNIQKCYSILLKTNGWNSFTGAELYNHGLIVKRKEHILAIIFLSSIQ